MFRGRRVPGGRAKPPCLAHPQRKPARERGFPSRLRGRPGGRRGERHAGSNRSGGAFDRGPRHRGTGLYDTATAAQRLEAACAGIDQSREDVVLVARTEGLLFDPAAVGAATERVVAFADAGADCLYAPGIHGRDEIAGPVRAVAPKPLNVVMMRPGQSFIEPDDLGERRVSIGGALARVRWATVVAAARELRDGRFNCLSSGVPASALEEAFRPSGARSIMNDVCRGASAGDSCFT
jgi:hypothetical protein